LDNNGQTSILARDGYDVNDPKRTFDPRDTSMTRLHALPPRSMAARRKLREHRTVEAGFELQQPHRQFRCWIENKGQPYIRIESALKVLEQGSTQGQALSQLAPLDLGGRLFCRQTQRDKLAAEHKSVFLHGADQIFRLGAIAGVEKEIRY
jgi:hypothetical protein